VKTLKTKQSSTTGAGRTLVFIPATKMTKSQLNTAMDLPLPREPQQASRKTRMLIPTSTFGKMETAVIMKRQTRSITSISKQILQKSSTINLDSHLSRATTTTMQSQHDTAMDSASPREPHKAFSKTRMLIPSLTFGKMETAVIMKRRTLSTTSESKRKLHYNLTGCHGSHLLRATITMTKNQLATQTGSKIFKLMKTEASKTSITGTTLLKEYPRKHSTKEQESQTLELIRHMTMSQPIT
jgi:hypothetical protein